jgi:hypothetical protein
MSGRTPFTLLTLVLASGAAACAPDAGSLDEETKDEATSALEAPAITFAADWSETVHGKLRAEDPIALRFDPARLADCRGEQGGVPQWSITAYSRSAGGEIHATTVAGLNAPEAVSIIPDEKGPLEVWFQVTNRWGCNAYDSNLGQNYRFDVAQALGEPGFVGNPASVINRATCAETGGPCDQNRVDLENGFVFDTWARQRAAIAGLYFDVWEEGVTDHDNPDLWREVDAQIHLRFAGQSAFTARYVDFFRRVGNDARYEVRLRTIDPFFAQPSVVAPEGCPDAVLTPSADGNYVTTTVEYYFTVDGVELRPEDGGLFHGRFEDYVSPYAACL